MAEKIEGYKKRGEVHVPLVPKEHKVDIKVSEPKQGSSMDEFKQKMESRSIDDHIKDISSGRGNGIPDNYKEKKKAK